MSVKDEIVHFLFQAAINEYSFVIFALLTVFFIIFQYFYLVETKGKSIDEIQRDLRSKMSKNHNLLEYQLDAKTGKREE
jgi:Sugar (and other) transporter